MIKTFTYALVALALTGCVSDQQNRTADYPIRLARTTFVGDHYRIAANGSDEQLMRKSIDGVEMPPTADSYTIECVAECEVLALTPSGLEKRAKLSFEKITRRASGRSVDLLPAGTVVIGERIGDKIEFSVAGRPVPVETARALETAGIAMHNDDSGSDDDIFGTTERKKVGDFWPINSKAAAAVLSRIGVTAEANKIAGTTTLVEKVGPANRGLLRISGTMTMQGVSLPLPPGFAIDTSAFTANYTWLFPIDLTKRRTRESMTMAIDFAFSGTENGKQVVVTMTKKASREAQFGAP